MTDGLHKAILGGLMVVLGVTLMVSLGEDQFTGERTGAFWAGLLLVVAGAGVGLVGLIRLGNSPATKDQERPG